MTLKTHKRPDAQSAVIQHGAQPAALRPFNQTLLLQAAMVHFDPPRRERKLLALGFAHLLKTRRPEVLCADGEHEPEIL